MRSASLFWIFVAAATPCSARDFNFELPSDQKLAIGAFTNLAAFCTQLGFTRVEPLPQDTMQEKLEAYMLLANDRASVLDKWSNMLHDWTQLNDAPKDKVLLDRAADAVIAAAKDPDSYEQAEDLYVATAMGPANVAQSACERAAADDFVGKYFVSGRGSVETWRARLKQSFAQSVDEIRAEIKKPASRRTPKVGPPTK
jgi:hypothetical protein